MSSRAHYDASAVRAVDIVAVIGEYVRLERKGATGRFSGLCPFHQEKTPSFSVHQQRQFYKCFGCGASGDVLKFVMEHDGLSFPEALQLIAERASIAPSTPWTEAQHLEREQRARGRDDAHFFGIAAVALAESVLAELQRNDPQRCPYKRIRRIAIGGGNALVDEYISWRAAYPELTPGMVHAGRASDARVQRRLAIYFSEVARHAA